MRYLFTGLAAALLAGCIASPMAVQSPPQTVVSEGVSYKVEQVTASTWSVTLPPGTQTKAHLVKAIEIASKCKVTDSSYGQHGTALNAQVDCGEKPKN
jgi:hypothetical protein